METIILGAGGHAKVILDMLGMDGGCKSDGGRVTLLDDQIKVGTRVLHSEVKGKIADCLKYRQDALFVIGIGDNLVREKIAERYSLSYLTLVHPSAVIGSEVEIGEGTVIMAGAVINSGSRIGRHCIINTGATIDHDCVLQDFVHISPGAHLGGSVEIGRRSWIGIGSCVKNDVSICRDCILGAGSTAVKNVTKPGIYIGTPLQKSED